MKVKITLEGPQGSGKTLIAEFLQRQLQTHAGAVSVLTYGSQPRGPEYDSLEIETTPAVLSAIANS